MVLPAVDGRRIRMTTPVDTSDSGDDPFMSGSSHGDVFELERWPANWLKATNCPSKGVCVVIKSLPQAFLHHIVTSALAGSADNLAACLAAAQRLCAYAAQQEDLNIHLQVIGWCLV